MLQQVRHSSESWYQWMLFGFNCFSANVYGCWWKIGYHISYALLLMLMEVGAILVEDWKPFGALQSYGPIIGHAVP